jgi:hypothetical protein
VLTFINHPRKIKTHAYIAKCSKSDEKEQAGAIVIAQMIWVDFLHSYKMNKKWQRR